MPYTSHKIEDSLVIEDKLSLADYQQAQAIVLLGGGLRDSKELYDKLTVSAIPLERVRYAAYLQKQTQLPLLITGSSPKGISEAQIMANELNTFFLFQQHGWRVRQELPKRMLCLVVRFSKRRH